MKYALTGSHGVGKTTVVNVLTDWLEENGLKAIVNSSNARKIKQSGGIVNEEGDDQVQLIVECSHVSKFCEDNWFADRSVIDGYAYTEYLYKKGKVSGFVLETVEDLMNVFIKNYTEIFYIPIEFTVTDDGIRKNDELFQKEIDEIVLNTLKNSGVKYHTISGTVFERVEKIKSIVHPHYDS